MLTAIKSCLVFLFVWGLPFTIWILIYVHIRNKGRDFLWNVNTSIQKQQAEEKNPHSDGVSFGEKVLWNIYYAHQNKNSHWPNFFFTQTNQLTITRTFLHVKPFALTCHYRRNLFMLVRAKNGIEVVLRRSLGVPIRPALLGRSLLLLRTFEKN